MKAGFIFNDWAQDLTGLDLIVCAPTLDPERIRLREDVKPGALLACYVTWDLIPATPWGTTDQWHARLRERMLPHLYRMPGDVAGVGWVQELNAEGAGVGPYHFSSFPWPKLEDGSTKRDQWDLRMTFERAREMAWCIAHELPATWDALYVDNCRPMPRRVYDRLRDASAFPRNMEKWSAESMDRRSSALLAFFLAELRSLRDVPLIGNSAGNTYPWLTGICIEEVHQHPANGSTLAMAQVLARFQKQAEYVRTSGSGEAPIQIDLAGRMEIPELGVYRGRRIPKPEAGKSMPLGPEEVAR